MRQSFSTHRAIIMLKHELVLLITVLCFTIVKNVCIKSEDSNSTNTIYSCAKAENYISDINKLSVPDGSLKLVIIISEIHTLKNNGFSKFENVLTALIIRYNLLESVEDEAFKGLTKLEKLALTHGQLKEVKGIWFKDLINLEYLELQENDIVDFDPTFIQKLPKLRDINLSDNRLTCFNISFVLNLKPENVVLRGNPFDWICVVPIINWNQDTKPKVLRVYYEIADIINTCYDKVTDGINKSEIIDECMETQLNNAIMNPELYNKHE